MNSFPESGIRELTRLRRVQRDVDPAAAEALESTVSFLLGELGPTVKRSVAARLLGVSQPALDKWVAAGEIATVRTPSGRREIPVSEIVELLEELEDDSGAGRPLAAAIRRRRERVARSLPVDLLPWDPSAAPAGHRRASLRSLAYHRAVAKRLTPAKVEAARLRLDRWEEQDRIDSRWAREWRQLLAQPLPRLVELISEDTPHADDLRQSSPFAGTLSDYERRRILDAVEATVE